MRHNLYSDKLESLLFAVGAKKFVIFSFPRTRSNLLCNHLDSHPNIICHYEVFHQDEVYVVGGYDRVLGLASPTDTAARDADPLDLAGCLYQADLSGRAKAIGFKMFPEHNADVRRALAKDSSVLKILLTRDPIYAFTSWKIALADDEWTNYTATQPREKSTVVDLDEFIAWYYRIADYFEEIKMLARENGSSCMDVKSLDVADGTAAALIAMQLGLIPAEVKSDLRPQNTLDLQKRIENYETVRAELMKRNLGCLLPEKGEIPIQSRSTS